MSNPWAILYRDENGALKCVFKVLEDNRKKPVVQEFSNYFAALMYAQDHSLSGYRPPIGTRWQIVELGLDRGAYRLASKSPLDEELEKD